MGRPPTPIGAHGEISVKQVTLKDGRVVFEARCRFRAADGSLPRMKRTRRSETAARTALKAAVVDAVNEVRGGEISPDTRLKKIAEKWYADEIELAVAEGRKAPKTAEMYRCYLDVHILPALGSLL